MLRRQNRKVKQDTAVLPDHISISLTAHRQHLEEVGKGLKCQEFKDAQPVLSYLAYEHFQGWAPYYRPRHAILSLEMLARKLY